MIMLDYGLERPGNDPFLLRAVGQTEREFRASLAATIKHTFDVQNEAIETLQKQLGKKYVPYSGPPLLVEDK